ncbi:solute carrier family 52, riboflavin transporter, member 3 [Plakobranchus ocellatus]|uniref:Riboflavin transporter n=1 Tax=Plakobranchus ocellatus TaxID=259542 RepID=A0AAV4BI72_9GAST|nr:solute carrier family 52, riboflavin transporter, member 3 [Plakobranchus ocellatus]
MKLELEARVPLRDKEDIAVKKSASTSNSCGNYFYTMAENIRLQLGDTKLVVHILVATFAIASWADMNGMWSELPQLTIHAPEQWTLPSYIIIISQIANVGPIIFVMVSYFLPRTRPQLEISTSFGIIIVSLVAAFLMGFFWSDTSYLAGQERSTAMLLLNFFLAVGDCTSSVCFYAYMSLLKPQYMASLLLGEGLSGFIPGMLALIQGAGDVVCVNGSYTANATFPNGTEYNVTKYSVYPMYEEPLFSVKVYFIIVSVIIAGSAIAFVILNKWSYCSSEFVGYKEYHCTVENAGERNRGRSPSYGSVDNEVVHVNGDKRPSLADQGNVTVAEECLADNNANSSREMLHPSKVSVEGDSKTRRQTFRARLNNLVHLENIGRPKFFFLLLLVIVINMTHTTFLPSIQIYTVLPYGLEFYHLTTSLIQMANPLACFFAVFVMAESAWIITLLTVVGEIMGAYLIYIAAKSPHPPMHDESGGGEISVCLWILATLLLIYAKVCIAGVLRKYGGRSALIWAGFVTQVGTTIGALVGFVLVNHYHTFKDAPFC